MEKTYDLEIQTRAVLEVLPCVLSAVQIVKDKTSSDKTRKRCYI